MKASKITYTTNTSVLMSEVPMFVSACVYLVEAFCLHTIFM